MSATPHCLQFHLEGPSPHRPFTELAEREDRFWCLVSVVAGWTSPCVPDRFCLGCLRFCPERNSPRQSIHPPGSPAPLFCKGISVENCARNIWPCPQFPQLLRTQISCARFYEDGHSCIMGGLRFHGRLLPKVRCGLLADRIPSNALFLFWFLVFFLCSSAAWRPQGGARSRVSDSVPECR